MHQGGKLATERSSGVFAVAEIEKEGYPDCA
jgi:hypothetical protein